MVLMRQESHFDDGRVVVLASAGHRGSFAGHARGKVAALVGCIVAVVDDCSKVGVAMTTSVAVGAVRVRHMVAVLVGWMVAVGVAGKPTHAWW